MRTLFSIVLAAGLLAASTATAKAQAPVAFVNPYFSCSNGQAFAPAGSEVVLRIGWAAETRGLVQEFVIAETTSLSIDGVPATDADDDVYRTPIVSFTSPVVDDGAVSRWLYPTGIVLGSGESFSFVYDSVVRHRLHDGVVPDEDGHGFNMVGPGSIFSGPIACTVTGV